MRKLLILDNYDSFTYNLVQLIENIGVTDFEVIRNNKISLEEVNRFEKILLSPGAGLPKDAGIMPELLKKYSASKSILGVCLGLQAIGEAFGASLSNLETVYHGIAAPIMLTAEDHLFALCPSSFTVGRYHSWVVSNLHLPQELIVTSVDAENNIMSLKHKMFDVRGVQFHPESILSENGEIMMKNWLGV